MYSKTIAGRRNNPRSNIPAELYVSPDLLQSLWETPMQITRGLLTEEVISKQLADIIKGSAMHIKEGHVYEGMAAVWDNPLKPIDISKWGELNNIGGGGMGTRNANFKEKIIKETRRAMALARAALGSPPPETPKTKYQAYWGQVTKWESTHREDARPDGWPPGDGEKPNWDGPATRGHRFMPLIFKGNANYFVAPKFSTVELRLTSAFKKGKGQEFIELDGLIHIKMPDDTHKFMILELKKGLGVKGAQDAEQMRKGAMLLRKWGYELTGKVPIVELYFAAGAADSFSSGRDGYEYQSESNSVQDWTPQQVQRAVEGAHNHLVYLRTPVFLLTGIGFADLLRIDTHRIAKIRSALTEASNITDLAKWFRNKDEWDFFEPVNYLLKRVGLGVQRKGNFEIATREDVAKIGGRQLYIDLYKLVTENKEFRAMVPEHWRPDPKKIIPASALARVSEGLLYINALTRKIAKPGQKNNKKAELTKDLISYYKYLLSNRYSKFLKPNVAAKLRTNLGVLTGKGAGENVPSPTVNTKFYKRIISTRVIL